MNNYHTITSVVLNDDMHVTQKSSLTCHMSTTRMCAPWRCKSARTLKAKLLWITLWANSCTKCHGNTISRFHLIAHYVNGLNFSQYSVTLIVFLHNLCSVDNNRLQCICAQNLNIVTASVPQIWRGAKSWNDDLVPLAFDLFWFQNQQTSTNCGGLLLCQVSCHSDQGFSFYRADIHTHPPTHAHRDKVVAISAPPYYVVGVRKRADTK